MTINIGMLVSHTHKFIFLKCRKTAGTSVEAYFDQLCLPPDEETGLISRDGRVTKYGIVSSRSHSRPPIADPGFESVPVWNHMPAHELKDIVGNDTWNSYYKFCGIRNPYERMVSLFWYASPFVIHAYKKDPTLKERGFAWEQSLKMFEETMMLNWKKADPDYELWSIDNEVVVDDVIRYETLVEDCARISEKIGHTFTELPRHRTASRKHTDKHYSEYFVNPKVRAEADRMNERYCEQWGYSFAG